jgi:hypothetical protein
MKTKTKRTNHKRPSRHLEPLVILHAYLIRFWHSYLFYRNLRKEFDDMDGAKKFYDNWRITQEWNGTELTLRAMAYHCGRVLQGWRYDHNANGFGTSYIEVPEAIELYNYWGRAV